MGREESSTWGGGQPGCGAGVCGDLEGRGWVGEGEGEGEGGKGLPVCGWVGAGLLDGEAILSSRPVAGSIWGQCNPLDNGLFESVPVPDLLSGTLTGSISGLGSNPNQPNRHAGGRMASCIPESHFSKSIEASSAWPTSASGARTGGGEGLV